jgi:hypothetical protein
MVFHKYKLIFTGIPKNASSSIYDILKNNTDKYHHHESLVKEYTDNDTDLMELYRSVCIVRNPYDRFFSGCYQIRRDEDNVYLSFDEILLRIRDNGIFNEVFFPQHIFICFGNKILIDKILRFESLEKDWKEYVLEYNKNSKFKIDFNLPQSNITENKKNWEEEIKLLSDDDILMINQLYAKDFELFDYKMITR